MKSSFELIKDAQTVDFPGKNVSHRSIALKSVPE
jgi:hypothetical protein